MASMGGDGGQLFHCHQCDTTVRPATLSSLTCPHCHGDFLEELLDSPPSSPELHSPWDYMGGFGQILDDISTFLARTDVSRVNPFLLFQSQMQNLLSMHDEDFSSENGSELDSLHMPGDHSFGPGIQQLIQQLAENYPNRYGNPPASVSAVDELPTISITQEHLGTDASQCAICKDEFESCLEVKQMPCKHLYHPDCILPWLALHNTCPVCRFELPTDDPDYEQARTRPVGCAASPGFAAARSAEVESRRGSGSSSSGSIPGQHFVGRFPIESGDASEQQIALSGRTSGLSQVCSSVASEGGRVVTRRQLSATTPWLMDMAQSSANTHAESSSQANSGVTGSIELVEASNTTSGATSKDFKSETGDTSMSEARQGDPD